MSRAGDDALVHASEAEGGDGAEGEADAALVGGEAGVEQRDAGDEEGDGLADLAAAEEDERGARRGEEGDVEGGGEQVLGEGEPEGDDEDGERPEVGDAREV